MQSYKRGNLNIILAVLIVAILFGLGAVSVSRKQTAENQAPQSLDFNESALPIQQKSSSSKSAANAEKKIAPKC